jgi:translation elongation factor EF-4
MKARLLDRMDLLPERRITMKLAPMRTEFTGFELNLIDAPGVDLGCEASRRLQCALRCLDGHSAAARAA